VGQPRDIIEEDRFGREKAQLYKDARRADDALQGILDVICRRPESGSRCGDAGMWYAAAQGWDVTPFVLFYRWDERHVHLLSIIRAQPDAE